MEEYIFIDGSYFIFYRVFALKIWWRNAKPDIPLVNPFDNSEFVEKFESTFVSKIQEIQKKTKMKNAKIIVGCDCKQSKIWRKQYYENYKDGRDETKNKEYNIDQFFKFTYENKLFEKAGAELMLQMDTLEADDCIALYVKHLQSKNINYKIVIITSDHDYLQLGGDNISIMNLKYKHLIESKNSTGIPEKDLFNKIVMGDKSDNILPIFKKCPKKILELCFQDKDYFQNKCDEENVVQNFQLNRLLIDFNFIPEDLKINFKKKYLVNE